MVLGNSAVGGFATLQTRRSPSIVCAASISDFCFVDEACHAKFTIGDGARLVVRVCSMVNLASCLGSTVDSMLAMRMDPFRYLSLT